MDTCTFEPGHPLQRRPKGLNQSRNLSSVLAQILAEQITNGALDRGQRMPPEVHLMAEHGVSRTVVREAISKLQTRGLIITRHGIGSFVSDTPDFDSPSGSGTSLGDVLAIIELRISVEVEAAGFAAQRRSPLHLAGMQTSLETLADPTISRDVAAAADHEFHRQIALATGNRYFVDITDHLGIDLIPRKGLDSAALNDGDRTEYSLRLHREHRAIYQGIAEGDPAAAKAAMQLHLSNIRERLRHANLR
ncbi:FadR/GntR family transcriptional regulator [Pseudomonas sp. RGM2987]|uniref:FadR/GntR family transcriptional regulator n=1 Tax=Pseudomonas sp. RGM2987 TaxID=2930090 RepID=UPI001FD70734|nr:FadR/GntR family transcriptional regulator [Pseudomonas sp. RGM2987]MCJ8205633.1 FadR family transcriptional regulator [Pseudomonas sp. RGM2987]